MFVGQVGLESRLDANLVDQPVDLGRRIRGAVRITRGAACQAGVIDRVF